VKWLLSPPLWSGASPITCILPLVLIDPSQSLKPKDSSASGAAFLLGVLLSGGTKSSEPRFSIFHYLPIFLSPTGDLLLGGLGKL
jgi:hypothetical protein